MARPREFDEATVLEAAMNCFWQQGYEATSVRDLSEQMGITGASLYNAFGDKRSLYRQALAYYVEHSVHDRINRLQRLPPLDAIRCFFSEIIERSVTDGKRAGCFLVNAALEVAPYDPAIGELVRKEMELLESFFCRCVARGQEDGTIAAGQSVELGKLLLSVLLGLRVLARTRPQRDMLEGAVAGVLGMLKK